MSSFLNSKDSYFIIAVLVFQIITFTAYGLDKYYAIHGKRRIPEIHLLLLAFVAPFGAMLGMQTFRHKTRKKLFLITTTCALALHVAWILFYFKVI